jgi:hypothetical protein
MPLPHFLASTEGARREDVIERVFADTRPSPVRFKRPTAILNNFPGNFDQHERKGHEWIQGQNECRFGSWSLG